MINGFQKHPAHGLDSTGSFLLQLQINVLAVFLKDLLTLPEQKKIRTVPRTRA